MAGLGIVQRLAGDLMTLSRKTFTIEKSMPRETVPEEQALAVFEATAAIPQSADIRRVLSKLDELGAMIQPTQSIVSNIADAYRRLGSDDKATEWFSQEVRIERCARHGRYARLRPDRTRAR